MGKQQVTMRQEHSRVSKANVDVQNATRVQFMHQQLEYRRLEAPHAQDGMLLGCCSRKWDEIEKHRDHFIFHSCLHPRLQT